MRTPRYSVKQTDSSVPLVPALCKIHWLPLTQGCQPLLINSTTGHYNSTGMYSTSLWSAFLTSVQQGRALECAFVALNSTGTHCHAYRKYTGSLRNTDGLYNQDTQWWSHDVRNRRVALYSLLCKILFT